MECSDVELVHLEDGGIAAHDEGQASELGNAVGNPHRQLLVKVLGTSLQKGPTRSHALLSPISLTGLLNS